MKKLSVKEKKRILFYTSVVAFPVLQFIVFYIVVNLQSILFAFQSYDGVSKFDFVWFDNFKEVFKCFATEQKLSYAWKNSLVLYFFTLVVGTGGAIFFSNYIYKKNFGHKLFQVVLFLPHIISGVVLMTVYKFLLDQGIPQLGKALGVKILPLLDNYDDHFKLVLIFQLWMGFGTQVLMYTSTMSGISSAVVESAQLDGITPFKELIFITLPMIYPTFVTFITVGVAGLFTNQMSLYNFYGNNVNPKAYTLGYYLFRETQVASSIIPPDVSKYPKISALGLIFTLIAVPITFVVKWAMEKLGPSVD
ncbi:MAG: sugar ABC transporter permease [Clostridia bacterium]|nr:sugar ABC transporter permease [Clostridia bacterium]